MAKNHDWPVDRILTCADPEAALILLNRPILIDKAYFTNLWNAGTFLNKPPTFMATDSLIRFRAVCLRTIVDGGVNRYIKFVTDNSLQLRSPDIVCGDFDSCAAESMDYVKQLGSKIVHTPDQNETDFTKAVKLVTSSTKDSYNTIYVVAETSGRLDQILGNINTLLKIKRINTPETNRPTIFMVSSNSISWLLEQGVHKIHIPEHLAEKRLWCALIPVTGPSVVTTTGLKWNLSKLLTT
jgi:thiamine pyrophosphokinase